MAPPRAVPADRLGVRASAAEAGIGELTLAFDQWLVDIGADAEHRRDLGSAVVELVTNSVEHAPRGCPDRQVEIWLEATLESDGLVCVRVADNGVWRDTEDPTDSGEERVRGYGLAMVAQLVDAMRLSHNRSGTWVEIRMRLTGLTRTAKRYPLAALSPHEAAEPFESRRDPQEPGAVWLGGALTRANSGRLGLLLDVETRAGTRPLVLDLSAVTVLSSAAVRVLRSRQLRARQRAGGLVLRAAAGTPAARVLEGLAFPADAVEVPRNA